MAIAEYEQWLARGRSHQGGGRPIDAMLCFRRALRSEPRASDARFHLGEVLWQLGQLPAAQAEWREAARHAPRHVAPQIALAEAALATGDAETAREAATQVLLESPTSARAALIQAIARVLLATEPDARAAALAVAGEVVEREPALLQALPIVEPLAFAIDPIREDAVRDFVARIGVVAAAAGILPALPAIVLALLVENLTQDDPVRAAVILSAGRRDYALSDDEALRRIAAAIDAPARDLLAARYAALCARTWSQALPLLWPTRTFGAGLRIAALIAATSGSDAAAAAMRALAELPGGEFDTVFAIVGGDALPENLASAAPTALGLPADPDIESARALAAFDPDVLVDFAGLTAITGPLLAMRPARRIVTLATLPAPNVPPLVDVTLRDAADLDRYLRDLKVEVGREASTGEDSAALGAMFHAAVLSHREGDRVAARAGYERILAAVPGYALAHFLHGNVLLEGGERGLAREAFAAALAQAPDYLDARIAAMHAALDALDPDDAIAIGDAGVARAPLAAPLWRKLGLAHLARGDGEAASSAFTTALAIDPTDGETHYNHGVALQMRRALPEAARAYQRALAFRPDLSAADFNIGVVFQEQGQVDAAIGAYGNVLARDPRHVAAYRHLGQVLQGAGRIDAWLANFRRFETNCPDSLPLAVQALEAAQHLADFPRLEHYLDGLRNERFHAGDETELIDALEELLFLLLNFDVEPEMIHRFSRTYDEAARHVYGEALPRGAARRAGRLRVGYLSGDLRNHVMGRMAWSAIEHHDKARFEIFCYSLSDVDDGWTARFRGLADRFDAIPHLSERSAAEHIARDDLDILVDLSTHTRGARPGILARKPARVLITHVASAGTLGLSAVDFKLTDRYADVPENATFQIEALLPMDGCVYPFRAFAAAPIHPFRRDVQGIAADFFLIGAFVGVMKLSRRCLTLWRDVLERIPRARLVFSPAQPALRPVYERLALAAGISAERLVFLPQGRDEAENQARYSIIDCVLDTMPYGGVNGVLEPLAAGVPVVALQGKRHGERSAYSILANLGVTATVAESGREYVELAVRLADDAVFHREVRASIAAGLAQSTLTDRVGHTRSLERAYRAALSLRAPEALSGAGESPDELA